MNLFLIINLLDALKNVNNRVKRGRKFFISVLISFPLRFFFSFFFKFPLDLKTYSNSVKRIPGFGEIKWNYRSNCQNNRNVMVKFLIATSIPKAFKLNEVHV